MVRQRGHSAQKSPRTFGIKTLKMATAVLVLGAAIAAVGIRASAAPKMPNSPSGLLEFDYTPSGSSLNHAEWNTYITSAGAGGTPWNSNGEGGSTAAGYPDYDAEYDLARQVSQRGGTIILRATETPTRGILNGEPSEFPFASGVLSTYGKFEFTGGYVQITAKMPGAAGMWPGLWMLPGSGAKGVTAANTSEIDIFEGGARAPSGSTRADMYSWHLHTPAGSYGANINSHVNLTTQFNTYGLRWVPGRSITWYLNGKFIGSITSARATIPDEPMELLISLQVATAAASYWHSVYNDFVPLNNQMLISSVKVFSLG